MNLKIYRSKILVRNNISDRGFSLIETVIALTTLGVCLAYAMPLFLYAKINNSKSEIRTGALIVSQRLFDNIRSTRINESRTITDGESVTQPVNIDSPTDAEKLLTKAMGRQYETKVIYCEGYTADKDVCGKKYQKFKVEVSYNGRKVYDLEGTYTELE